MRKKAKLRPDHISIGGVDPDKSHVSALQCRNIQRGGTGSPAKIRIVVLGIFEVRELLLEIGIITLIILDNLELSRSKPSYSTEHKQNIFITRQGGGGGGCQASIIKITT